MYLGKAKPIHNEIHYVETSRSEYIAKDYIHNLTTIITEKKKNP
jgi:hypothetical protein